MKKIVLLLFLFSSFSLFAQGNVRLVGRTPSGTSIFAQYDELGNLMVNIGGSYTATDSIYGGGATDTLTSTFDTLGAAISTAGYSKLIVRIKVDINSSIDTRFAIKDITDGELYDPVIGTVTSDSITVAPEYIKFPNVDGNYKLPFDISGCDSILFMGYGSLGGGAIFTKISYSLSN